MQHIQVAQQPIYHLTPDHFLDMLKMGAQSVVDKENYINKINYFPVSDHDTGSNLAALMRYLQTTSYSTTQMSLLLKQIADASLIGACGNSGMILSAFFIGFASDADKLQDSHFTTNQFVECIARGVKQASSSVLEPVEGTILTVMKAWSNALNELAHHCNDFIVLFEKSILVAHDALEKTRFQLRANKQQHVVDAGAFGFMQFLSGMHKQLVNRTKKIASTIIEEVPFNLPGAHQHDEYPDTQYCFEILLKVDQGNIDPKELLLTYGNSLVINQSPSYLKIHIHTNEPVTLSHELKKYGIIHHQKIDDMRKQWAAVNQRKHSIALVTDTAGDLPKEWIEYYQIHTLPVQIRVGEHSFLDNISIDLRNLYHFIHQENLKATTSPPSPESVKRYLNFLACHYQSVIVITASSKLSSLHQIISNQADTIKQKQVTVIDSHKLSASQGLLVMKAAELIEQGTEHQAIVNKIEDLRNKTHFFVMADEFKTMVKSGRVPKILGWFAEWTGIKPILGFKPDGKPKIAGIAFGSNRAKRKLIKQLQKLVNGNTSSKTAVIHTGTPERAHLFAKQILDETGISIDHIYETNCGIGLHAGKGCLGIAVLTSDNS